MLKRRWALEIIGKKLGVSKFEDWYQIKKYQIKKISGSNDLLEYFGGNFQSAVIELFPEFKWHTFLFSWVPDGYWEEPDKQREFFDYCFRELKLKTWEDWYKVKYAQVASLGAGGLLANNFGNSLSKALMDIYPEYNWEFWKFERSQRGVWSKVENQRSFFESIARKIGIKQWEEWYNISTSVINEHNGEALLLIEPSIPHLISKTFPEYPWNLHKFKQLPNGFWREKQNQTDFIQYLAKQLNIESKEDWYKLSPLHIIEHGGDGFLQHFEYSMIKALNEVLPEYKLDFSKFSQVQIDLRNKFDKLGSQLNVSKLEDWYNVPQQEVEKLGGHKILNDFENSLARALMIIYPEYPWQSWRFLTFKQKGYWKEMKNQRDFLDNLAQRLQIKSQTDWYNMKVDTIIENGGSGILQLYNNSLYKMISTIYPEKDWKIFLFNSIIPAGYWDSDKNVRDFMEFSEKYFGIKNLDDWYEISSNQISAIGGYSLLKKFGGISQLLSEFYPKHRWNHEQRVFPSKIHRFLFKIIRILFFKNPDIHMNYIHPLLSFSDSNKNMEFDIFIPSLNLGFEYQGGQHYKNVTIYPSNTSKVQKRDSEKLDAAKKEFTLIVIPYWWDNTKESLWATILTHRPDLRDYGNQIFGTPIPKDPPLRFQKTKE